MTFEQQIRAAEGYVELGMPAEALAHLNEIRRAVCRARQG